MNVLIIEDEKRNFNRLRRLLQVIFITAYDEYAIRAFKYNGIDYLLKPVDPDELAAAVDKARRMRRQATEDNMRQLIEQMRRGGYRWRERFLCRVALL